MPSFLSNARKKGLTSIRVNSHGFCDGDFKCSGTFDPNFKFEDGFDPIDDGYWGIGDWSIEELICMKKKGVKITYSPTCQDVKEIIEAGVVTDEIKAMSLQREMLLI